MKVRPGGAARLPRCPQRLTCLHHLSGPNEEVLQMGVKRLLPAVYAVLLGAGVFVVYAYGDAAALAGKLLRRYGYAV